MRAKTFEIHSGKLFRQLTFNSDFVLEFGKRNQNAIQGVF